MARFLRPQRDAQLLRDRIDGVDGPIGVGQLRQLLVDAVLVEERAQGGHLALGIHVEYHLAHDLGFGAPERRAARDCLAVDVARRHAVAVEQHEMPHAAARKGHCAVGADASQPQDGNGRAGEPLYALIAQDEPEPVERALVLLLWRVAGELGLVLHICLFLPALGLSRAFMDACRPSENARLARSISIVESFAMHLHSMRAICARMHYSYRSFNRFYV